MVLDRLVGTVAKTRGGYLWVWDIYGQLHSELRTHNVLEWGPAVVGVSSERGRIHWNWADRCSRGGERCVGDTFTGHSVVCLTGLRRLLGPRCLHAAFPPCEPIPVHDYRDTKAPKPRWRTVQPREDGLTWVTSHTGTLYKFLRWNEKDGLAMVQNGVGDIRYVEANNLQHELDGARERYTLLAFYYQTDKVRARKADGSLITMSVKEAKRHASLVDVPVLESS